MKYFKSPFSKWVLPVRLAGLGIVLLGFAQIVLASDAAGIVVAVIGSAVWQAGMALEKRSPLFQLLNSTPVRHLMRTKRTNIPSSWTVAKAYERLSFPSERTFFVTTQDGYESGIALPEQLRELSEDKADDRVLGQIAQPISYVDAIRDIDPLLTAFDHMERHRNNYVTVLDGREYLVGVVTKKQLAKFIANADAGCLNLPSRPTEPEYRKAA